MSKVNHIKMQTSNRFLNLYELEAEHRDGRISPYFLASRSEKIEDLKISTGKNSPDGVAIYGLYGEKKDKVALVKQFRYPINDYIYEFPAGLVEPGEDVQQAAVREMYEETGLTLTPVPCSQEYQKAYFTTIGMTDESCATVYGYLSGEPTNRHQEAAEDIQVILADREECKRILKEENVAIICAYMLMHFIHDTEEPFAFLK
ncbi:NUDIX hydrolase [Anaerosporobacter faecicola]|uniref:NUDIX hydrolase n=1 Tax=Anaerosporobacter faecicola TaxID=2718714 RepID=UPI0014389856|nr:NUDIX hydrolase [Anaerosporobacter faecicola]